ncbi:MAG: hypothetical protein ACUVWK_07155 [Nitrososphaerales archaeon]
MPVGGEIAPISGLALSAPLIALAIAVLAVGSAALSRRKLFLH